MNAGQGGDHAALMDGVYRGQKYIYDLTRKYYLLGRDRLIEELSPPAGGTVLELGCGTGRNLILASRRWSKARFVGLDISEEMLGMARAQIAKRGLSDRIALVQGDATAPDVGSLQPDEGFDRIFLSFCISMVPDWRGVVEAALDLLSPGGELHIVDFGSGKRLPGIANDLLRAWMAKFHVSVRDDLPALIAEIDRRQGFSGEVRQLYRGYSVAAVVRKYGELPSC